jgi:hypothetical protein
MLGNTDFADSSMKFSEVYGSLLRRITTSPVIEPFDR